jgi:hypothetical protein
MRYNDAATNRQILRLLLETAGFELVRSLSVWGAKIIDNVFINAKHFLGPAAAAMPPAVLRLLRADKPRHSPSHSVALRDQTIQHGAWETTKLVDGKLCCGPYATTVPRSLLVCTNESEAC